jgi:hypothetical protein
MQAIEGYIDLGMLEEAEEELRELDPAWFAFPQTLTLQLRVLARSQQRRIKQLSFSSRVLAAVACRLVIWILIPSQQ